MRANTTVYQSKETFQTQYQSQPAYRLAQFSKLHILVRQSFISHKPFVRKDAGDLMRKREIKNQESNNRGFTLVELIVVISILGILALIAIPRLGAHTADAQNQVDEANARTLSSVAQAINANHSGYPAWSSSFTVLTVADATVDGEVYLHTDIEIQNPANEFGYDITTGAVVVQ